MVHSFPNNLDSPQSRPGAKEKKVNLLEIKKRRGKRGFETHPLRQLNLINSIIYK
jgi:hypothetical protein